MLPLRRPRYKRCSRTFNVTITPHMAEAIESFEDTPLSDYLQDQLGVPEGEDVEAEVHLFEVLAGGTAADIARSESETPGLGAADEVTLSQLQPLTHEAAGVLLGTARSRPHAAVRASGIRTVAPGPARLSHGRRATAGDRRSDRRGRRRVRRLVRVNVILDAPRDQVRVCVFLSEVKAQRLAVRLRQQSHVGALAVGSRSSLGAAPAHPARQAAAPVAHRAPGRGARRRHRPRRSAGCRRSCRQVFVAKLQEWLAGAFAEFAKTQAAEVPRRLGGSGRRRHADVHDRASARSEGARASARAEGRRGHAAWPRAIAKAPRRRSASTRSRDTSVTDPVQAIRAQIERQVAHWSLAASRLALDDLAAPEAWSRLEQYLGVSLRRHLQGVIDRVRGDADVLSTMNRAAQTPTRAGRGAAPAARVSRASSCARRRRSTTSPTRSPRARTPERRRCCARATRWRTAAWRRSSTRSASRRRSCSPTSTRGWARRS